jgi:hypothetical protein
MNFDQIYVHDGTLKSVIENPKDRKMTFLVDLPKDEWIDDLIPKRIIFHDVLNYSVHECPEHGERTILDLQIVGVSESRQKIRMETTSGYREWEASAFELQDDNEHLFNVNP